MEHYRVYFNDLQDETIAFDDCFGLEAAKARAAERITTGYEEVVIVKVVYFVEVTPEFVEPKPKE